ncbi:MAG TPA: BlaI/MecI/CopY family transcriptional regulator [Longimicrobium sp.]|nr:BlaI/MecI/CopY family transcriptional regulator [Longimicrobium sp.]
MTDASKLTELQLAILRVFWARGKATVPEVFRALWDERGLAQSTVATLVTRLEKRGLLAREGDARQYLYHATVSEDDVRRSMVAEMTHLLFGGDAAALVSHLVEHRELGRREMEQVRALLSQMEDDA